MDRRRFMQTPALAEAFRALYGAAAEAAPASVAGHITMAALAGDAARLAMCSGAIPAGVKDILARNQELVSIGGLVPLPVGDVPGLVDAAREKELALVLGSLIERAAGEWKPAPRADADCDVFRDVTLLGEVAFPQGGARRPAAEIYDLLLTLETRRLIGIHTFSPDAGDVARWLGALIRWRRESHALLKRYAELLSAPDVELARKYAQPKFYAREDGVIRLARAVQSGAVEARAGLGPALEAAGSLSQYARALRKAHEYIAAAGAYSTRSIDAAALVRRLSV